MEKPKLRGIVHLVMSPLSLVAGLILITLANELRGRITLGIFTLTAVTLFTCSALYHRVAWNDKNKAISLLRIFWLSAPRWLYVAGYISLGWAAVFYMPAFFNSGGVAIFILILTGGLLYSAGGVIYALKKPNFSISWFGFHELFHALTAAAFICHFVAAILTVFSNR